MTSRGLFRNRANRTVRDPAKPQNRRNSSSASRPDCRFQSVSWFSPLRRESLTIPATTGETAAPAHPTPAPGLSYYKVLNLAPCRPAVLTRLCHAAHLAPRTRLRALSHQAKLASARRIGTEGLEACWRGHGETHPLAIAQAHHRGAGLRDLGPALPPEPALGVPLRMNASRRCCHCPTTRRSATVKVRSPRPMLPNT